ncbi:hypothetical protein BD289DRAFT_197469 [Coniella lustricola]|uniref:Uncharacterized protein n=1 Tax=Coniella lustricola TaxID=2025994 RepID=A0A2T2ZSS2_9PEZI|nr:hypothetical protein BD289DRAFT_197469 [Coniella lustricola]
MSGIKQLGARRQKRGCAASCVRRRTRVASRNERESVHRQRQSGVAAVMEGCTGGRVFGLTGTQAHRHRGTPGNMDPRCCVHSRIILHVESDGWENGYAICHPALIFRRSSWLMSLTGFRGVHGCLFEAVQVSWVRWPAMTRQESAGTFPCAPP